MRRRSLLIAFSSIILGTGLSLSLAACSGGGGGGGGELDGSASSDGSAPTTDAGQRADGGGTTNDGGMASGPIIAQLSFSQNIVDDGMGGTAISTIGSALFAAPNAGAPNPCTNTVVAGCKVLRCTTGGVTSPSLNGGTVTISTPTIATMPFVLSLGDGGAYGESRTTQAFSAGDAVSFQTSGAPSFPAIMATLPAPSKIGISSPVVPVAGTLPIMLNQDFAVEWDVQDMPATGTVMITLAAPFTNGTLTTATCSFPVAAGQGTVPQAAFATFTAGKGQFLSSCISQTTVPMGAGTAVVTVGEGGDRAIALFQ
jgi:hypothetical protein